MRRQIQVQSLNTEKGMHQDHVSVHSHVSGLMQNWQLLAELVIFRLFCSFQIRTFFQPDEFYQSLEPAHHLIYGYGYISWEYQNAVRSISHALLFAVPYKVLAILRLDSPGNIRAIPKIIGGLQAACGDYYTILFVRKYWRGVGLWPVFATVFSPWNSFAMTRTFSNSLETTLTAFALYKWPFDASGPLANDDLFYSYVQTTIQSFAAIGFSFLIRPTTVLFWILPSLQQLQKYGTTFLFEAIFAAYVTLQYSSIIDSFYYGVLSFPALNFLRFNASGSASFYGVNDWHYYISQGLPFLLCAFLPFAAHGVSLPCPWKRELLSIVGLSCLIYSLLAHKEVRFIMQIMPILTGFVTASLANLARRRSMLSRCSILLAALLNVLLAYYATQIHQRGVIDLVHYLSNHAEINQLTLLMPCHSTPWQSHIHRPGNYRFLTCKPPLGLGKVEAKAYRDEADLFYNDPRKFMEEDQSVHGLPQYVGTFEASQEILEAHWASHKQEYVLLKRWFNSHIHDDSRRRGDVLLYKLAE